MGSEMCIRDRRYTCARPPRDRKGRRVSRGGRGARRGARIVASSDAAPRRKSRPLSMHRAAAATPAGAMLLAVMRGRSAEGADFKDDAARCVVIVGVPYPPRFDAATRLKIEHAGRDGETWYKAEAYRNVNQAAGRLIRHSKDYGALVLLDRALHKHPMMSEWFAERIERPSGATELHHRLRSFFSARAPLVID